MKIVLMLLAVSIFCAGFTFGVDRELARRDFEKAVHNGDYEQPIVGCLFESNCVYYTNKLGE